MSEQGERHGDAAAVFDCLKYHASAGGEYEYRGTLAIEAFDRICTTLLDLQAQRDELLAAAKNALSSCKTFYSSSAGRHNVDAAILTLTAAITKLEKVNNEQ